ncbi:sn-glycerol-3-phosphate transport system permease protein UgpA [Lactiplantibacillus plantarum]|nr:sugar ABC transporter permease [Lactiplantibacillus plantarum]MCG0671843.1 sugar ABC transporter permease [Lactiplantibacillus plantarum]MCG0872749.1 sugar ABC transporter permease [Lactiplantibacillus plantarum]MCG0921261.1 sugar ABC transporter permease [Lactiplantibacillus plantarum]OAZ75992.1 sn-glycerol-3-phosphate transport system permease protein UgpA [Lactiplantibacillus plantarum]
MSKRGEIDGNEKKPLKLARGLNGEHGQVWEAYLFLTPAFVIAAVFFVAAIVFALYMSFNHVNMISQQFEFTGFKNYIDVFKDNVAMTALKNTALFSVIVVPIQTIIALLIAYALSTRGIKGKKLFRLVYFLPTLTSSAALTLIFMFIFNISGPLNNFLISMGLYQHPINFLQNPAYALKVIMVMNIWSTVPNYMTVYLASLVDLPDSFYEAAEIDGASAWQKLRYITIPYLRPITTYVLLTGIIGTFQMFDQAYIFSNGSGGPDNSTLTIALMVYQYAFGSMNTMGYACTLAIVLTVIIFVVSRLTEKLNGSNGLR